jgi:Zn-dependent oligopeptidase
MEHWLMEKSTLYALIDASESQRPFSDESIDAAYRVRSRRKALELAQQTFYGSLEMTLFSSFDLKGAETLLALQQRLALELHSHDMPSKKDVTPLLNILQETANQRFGAYRYVWCDAISATIFDRFKAAYEGNGEAITGLRRDFRRLLIEPGAAVDAAQIAEVFEVKEISPEALFQRYNL